MQSFLILVKIVESCKQCTFYFTWRYEIDPLNPNSDGGKSKLFTFFSK